MRGIAFAVAVTSALVGTQVGAATIDLTKVGIAWKDVTTSASGFLGGVGTDQLRWGKPASRAGKSGYGFVGSESDGHDVDSEFVLGTFTHYNNPIAAGTSISKVTLNLSFDLLIDGTAKSVKSAFDFDHWETNNGKKGVTCADGGKFGKGINVKGCADRVKVSNVIDLLEEFRIGDAIYTMQITGFLLNGVAVTEFWTQEKLSNSAQLLAKFTKVRDVPPPPPPPAVPLPATGWLVLAGLAGLAGFRRRRG